jgi:hypothetical protein
VLDGPVGEIAVTGNVDLPYAVMADELAADLAELLAQERLAARQIEDFDLAHGLGQGQQFVDGQVIFAIQALPVEAVLAFLVAKGIDEENQQRRAGGAKMADPIEASLTEKAGTQIHFLAQDAMSSSSAKTSAGATIALEREAVPCTDRALKKPRK